jgi:hypothetical protein
MWHSIALYDTLRMEVEMTSYCQSCGRPMKGEDRICEACKENIRAEAMGRQRKIVKQTPKEAGKRGMHDRKGEEDNQTLTTPQEEEEDKKPHHFKSMADYLKYLKGKEGN